MHIKYLFLLVILFIINSFVQAKQKESYDYYQFERAMIQYGQQAIFMCNGLFTSKRNLEQIYKQELAFLKHAVGTPKGGDYVVDWKNKSIAVGRTGTTPIMRAVYREGIGCIILAPDQNFADIKDFPLLAMPHPPGDVANIPWPDGDMLNAKSLPSNIDKTALQAASDWAFNRPSAEQDTVSLLIVYKGQIIHERYATGFNIATKTRTWSTAKSIAATLIGILVDQGRLKLDEPLALNWLPEEEKPDADPRLTITLRHVLNMSSGLYTVDNRRMEYATGSGLSYWAGASSVNGARNRGLIRQPGTTWDYENYDTLLAVYAMKQALGNERTYLEYPRKALLDKIGMRNTFLSTDRFGDFILSSQVYTNARDLARLGLLYLQDGMWNGERIISKAWIKFVRTPAPSTAKTGNFYGGQFWLVPDKQKKEVPTDAYATSGNRGQYTIIVPSHDLVIVRRGLDYGRQGFNRWNLTKEVLKAIR